MQAKYIIWGIFLAMMLMGGMKASEKVGGLEDTLKDQSMGITYQMRNFR